MRQNPFMIEWLKNNSEWVFSGIGAALIAGIFNFLKSKKPDSSGGGGITINNTATNFGALQDGSSLSSADSKPFHIDKNLTRILFVDDDTRFKVVKILKNAGWPHVKIVKDISSLDSSELVEATILFVDIQGVGKSLGFSDEGLGLAIAIKKKYPEKKLVIYSSQPTGDRFHAALRAADDSIAKNADPYQFISLVETLSGK